jgi:hypothetical protein
VKKLARRLFQKAKAHPEFTFKTGIEKARAGYLLR